MPLKPPPARALRDLSDIEMLEHYDADRFTLTIISNHFRHLIDHVCAQLLTNAFSEIIRDYADMSAVLSGPPEMRFPSVAVAQTLPVFFGSMADAVRVALDEYGVDRLRPGDLILVNDPHRAGTHLNDVCFIRPVFHDERVIGAVTIRAHMLDWGGRIAGGFEATKANLYEDGLVLGPSAIYEGERPVASMFRLINDNTRFASVVLPDIQTIHHSLAAGERLLTATIRQYGLEAYLGAVRYACDASAEIMRAAISSIPDGEYEGEGRLDNDALSADGGLTVRVRVAKRGRRMELDFSGTSPSPQSALNAAWPDLKTAAMIAMKMLFDQRGAITSGFMRDIDIVAPPGCVVNPMPPASCNIYWEPITAAVYAMFDALAPHLGERAFAPDGGPAMLHQAHGARADGAPWFASAGSRVVPWAPWAPWGASQRGDGDSSQLGFIANLIDGGIEQSEIANPLVIMRKEYVADTAGAGAHRGGAASVADSYWREGGLHRAIAFKAKPKTGNGAGVNGGRDGVAAACWFWGRTDEAPAFLPLRLRDPAYARATPLIGVVHRETHELDGEGEYALELKPRFIEAGATIRWLCKGAGGWGDPLARDPERVLKDVRDEYVSVEGARRDYCVVIKGDPQRDPEGLSVDAPATAQLRASYAGSAV